MFRRADGIPAERPFQSLANYPFPTIFDGIHARKNQPPNPIRTQFSAPFEKRGLALRKRIAGESGPRQSFFSSARS